MSYEANAWKDLRTEQVYVLLTRRIKGVVQTANDWMISEKSFSYIDLEVPEPTEPTVCFDEYEALALYQALGRYFEEPLTRPVEEPKKPTKLDFSAAKEEG